MTFVVFVVINNFLLGIACLWIARKIWFFRRRVAVIADRILLIEQKVHRVLYPAPNAIRKAQRGTSRLRERYEKLGIQYARVQQIVSILSLAQLFVRYGRVLLPKSRSPQVTSKR
jgi:hypothetical protein